VSERGSRASPNYRNTSGAAARSQPVVTLASARRQELSSGYWPGRGHREARSSSNENGSCTRQPRRRELSPPIVGGPNGSAWPLRRPHVLFYEEIAGVSHLYYWRGRPAACCCRAARSTCARSPTTTRSRPSAVSGRPPGGTSWSRLEFLKVHGHLTSANRLPACELVVEQAGCASCAALV
jgi:hypothetical protein